MTRRMLVPCLFAGAAAAAPAADSPRVVRDCGEPWRLLYVGADDCPPCRVWRAANWSALCAAPIFAPIRFTELRAPRAAELLRDEFWPADLSMLRQEIPPDAAVPLWFLLRDQVVVQRAWGEPAWRQRMLPAIRNALEAQPAPTITRRTGDHA